MKQRREAAVDPGIGSSTPPAKRVEDLWVATISCGAGRDAKVQMRAVGCAAAWFIAGDANDLPCFDAIILYPCCAWGSVRSCTLIVRGLANAGEVHVQR